MRAVISKWWAGTADDLDEELRCYRNKVDLLSAIEYDLRVALENEEIQLGKKRKREVDWWFMNVKHKKAELEDIDCKFREQGPSKLLKSLIEKQTKEVEELILKGKFPNGVVLDDHASTRLPLVTPLLLGQSCSQNIESIYNWLKDDDLFVIGVHGMGGVGKTAILKQIHNCLLRNPGISGQVYWVTASRDCSLQQLQMAIGKTLGLDLPQEDDEKRRALLFHRFSQLRNSVLILDDIWKHYSLDKVGISSEQCGCKIVLSTRSLDVCRRMGCQKVIKVLPLNEQEAWDLFTANVGDVSDDLISIAEEIVGECGGLPLALITMGRSMRRVFDVELWENALCELRKPVSRQDDMEDEVYRVLKFSFDSLRDKKLQHCFLSCVLFREDEVISPDFLIDLWIMEGLLLDVIEYSWRNQVNKGHAILNRLVNFNLLEMTVNGSGQTCVTMHDLIRDMAIIITQDHPRFMAKSGLQMKRMPTEEQWSKDLEKASLRRNNIKEIPSSLSPDVPMLTVLMLSLNPIKQIPESFFLYMKALRVLDLRWTFIMKLPESVSDLESLRALLLEGCENLTYVPSLAKLVNLRVLDLPRVGMIKEVPRGLEKLQCLERLTNCRWNISDSISFNQLIENWPFPTHCSYEFWLHDMSDTYRYFILKPCYQKRYQNRVVILGANFGKEENTLLLPQTTTLLGICDIAMEGLTTLEDGLPSLVGVTGLQVLVLKECKGLEYILSARLQTSFCIQHLEHLELKKLPDWRGFIATEDVGTLVPIIPKSEITFSHLKQLHIVKCPKVNLVFPLKLLKQSVPLLQNLEEIKLVDCEALEDIFTFPITDAAINPIVTLPKLRTLLISMCPNIKVVFPLRFTQQQQQPHLSNLETIHIEHCKKLEEIFPSLLNCKTPIFTLPSLKCLKLRGLPELESIYRGLLCIPCNTLSRYECPKFNMVPLSEHSEGMVCDISWSTLASIPTYTDNQEWWAYLHQNRPKDARLLLGWVNEIHHLQRLQRVPLKWVPLKSPFFPDDQEQESTSKLRRKWGSLLQLSSN